MSDFGASLKARRQQAGMTQAELAECSGVPLRTIQQYERGARSPTWERLILLADALGISIDAFRADSTSPPPKKKRSRKST